MRESDKKPTERLTEKQWRVVKRTLPPDAEPAAARAELERIAREKSTPEDLAREHTQRAWLCREFRKALATMQYIEEQSRLSQQLYAQERHETERTELHRRMSRHGKGQRKGQGRLSSSIKFRRQCEILWLWQRLAGEPGYATGRDGPYGKAIDFFQAANEFIFGSSLGTDRAQDIISEFRKLNLKPLHLVGAGALTVDATIIGGEANPRRQIRQFR
jgi:hypothetical protein